MHFNAGDDPATAHSSSRTVRVLTRHVLVASAALIAGLAATVFTPAAGAVERGVPYRASRAITATTAQLNAASDAGVPSPRPTLPVRTNPARAHLPSAGGADRTPPAAASRASSPKTALSSGLSFDGPTLTDAGAFPPDTMGAVGPSQFIVAINGRFRSYNKSTGVADGALDADPDSFFAPVMTPPTATNFTSDPHIRYDRLSHRWIIVMIDVPGGAGLLENRVLVAVSDGPTITSSTTWSRFFFNEDAGGTDNLFADYPTLGVDAHALYIGMNMFALGASFAKTNMYVVRKSSILGGGPLVVTRFDGAVGAGAGPFTPQGVDNFDPSATQGYFIGVDNAAFSQLDVRRVSDPGGTPTLSGNLAVTVPATRLPIPVDHLGNTGGSNGRLDALDDRLYAAQMRDGRIWTAHDIGVDSSGIASNSPTRDASRWYEVNVDGTPSLTQSGTIFDPSSSNPKSYWIPTVAVSGQGTMAIGGSVAGAAHRPDPWFSGRLSGDAAGVTDAPTEYAAASAAYNPPGDPGGSSGRRWGDYSMTSVDPNDDMTMWTIQEYTFATNIWGTRIARLQAPPPATPASSSAAVPLGSSSTPVTITGTSAGGSGFFDPGPGFAGRIAAAVTGGVAVNGITVDDPTHVTLDLNTVGATAGAKNVTVTNPDGQSALGAGVLTVAPGHELTVAKAGSGSGTVTSSPAGINCGASCSQAYASGTAVHLTGSPAPGSTFAGWSGACSGTSGCNVTMSADRTVTATFKAKTPPPPSRPDTKITKTKVKSKKRKASISFKAIGSSTGFQCALSRKRKKGKFKPCSSPKTYKHLKRGRYEFKVRAVNAAGADPTPAKTKFKIKK